MARVPPETLLHVHVEMSAAANLVCLVHTGSGIAAAEVETYVKGVVAVVAEAQSRLTDVAVAAVVQADAVAAALDMAAAVEGQALAGGCCVVAAHMVAASCWVDLDLSSFEAEVVVADGFELACGLELGEEEGRPTFVEGVGVVEVDQIVAVAFP
jgi:hypothetical protein